MRTKTLAIALSIVGMTAASVHGRGDVPGPEVELSIPRVRGEPGGVLTLPVLVRTGTPLSMVGFSIEFDTTALELVEARLSPRMEEIASVLERKAGIDWSFEWFSNAEEGWVQGALVVDFGGREAFAIPPGMPLPLCLLIFQVKGDASPGEHPVSFTREGSATYEGHFRDGQRPVYNSARRQGPPFSREDRFRDSVEPDLTDGTVVVSIIGDVGIFVRGDANVDREVDISDPIHILAALFLGEGPLPCEDAADANDDGRIDISDPVAILDYLFMGTASDTMVSGAGVTDATPDALDCSSG